MTGCILFGKVDRSANYRVLIDNEPCFEDIRFYIIGLELIVLNYTKTDQVFLRKVKKV